MKGNAKTAIRNLKRLRTAVLLEGDTERAKRITQEIERIKETGEIPKRVPRVAKVIQTPTKQPVVEVKPTEPTELKIKNYENIDKLYALYNATGYEKQLVLDDFMYTIVESVPNGIERIRKYKCEDEEDLYLYIHLASDVVLKVYTQYEVSVSS